MPKKSFMDGYKKYDPEKEGYGNPDQWRQAFDYRMGFEEAVEILGDKNPYTVLEVSEGVTWDTIQSAYRKLAMKTHPDRNSGDDKDFLKVQAAYEILKKKYGK